MADTVEWRGVSGSRYIYAVHDVFWRPATNQPGNYIFAKFVHGSWRAVCIGHGDLQQGHDGAMRDGCVTAKEATFYHAHVNEDEAARRLEANDIITRHLECRWPEGCNGYEPFILPQE